MKKHMNGKGPGSRTVFLLLLSLMAAPGRGGAQEWVFHGPVADRIVTATLIELACTMIILLVLAGCAGTTGGPGDGHSDSADGPGDVDSDEACPDGTTPCGGECVDTSASHEHCGGCDEACEPAQVCMDGSCITECPAGMEECSGGCVDTETDPRNCGSCGNACGAGESCLGGNCLAGCPAGMTECSGNCVDTMIDPMNCGACGAACEADENCCAAGRCGVETLYGLNGDVAYSSLFRLGPAGDLDVEIGSTGIADGGDWALAYNPYEHVLYAIDGHDDPVADLWSIDPATAEPTLIGSTGLSTADDLDGGLAFDPVEKKLYFVAETHNGKIYLLDTATAEPTMLCELPITVANFGAAFDPDSGLLYLTGYLSPLYAMTSIKTGCEMIEVCHQWDPIYTHVNGLAWNPIENTLWAVESQSQNVILKVDTSPPTTACVADVAGRVTTPNVEGIEFGCWIEP